jgi:hypothetical protein
LEGKYLIYGGALGKSSVVKFAEWSAVGRRPRCMWSIHHNRNVHFDMIVQFPI